jgi:hypothetical protein
MQTTLSKQQQNKLRQIFWPTQEQQAALWAAQRTLWSSNRRAGVQYDEMDKTIAGGSIADIARMLYHCWQELKESEAILLREGEQLMESLSEAIKQADSTFFEEQNPTRRAA